MVRCSLYALEFSFCNSKKESWFWNIKTVFLLYIYIFFLYIFFLYIFFTGHWQNLTSQNSLDFLFYKFSPWTYWKRQISICEIASLHADRTSFRNNDSKNMDAYSLKINIWNYTYKVYGRLRCCTLRTHE